jgi:LacI family transcriptional regulator
MERIGIRQIAELAGVSPSTVSRALRNHPRLPPATCRRIQTIAAQLNFRPDPLISALVSRRKKRDGNEVDTIAYLTSHPTREGWRDYEFLREAYNGAEKRAREQGYKLEHFWLHEPGMTGRRLSRILFNRGIRGICIAPLNKGYGHIHLQWEHFSCATIGYSMIRPELHRSCPDQGEGMMTALRKLYHQGCRHIGIWLEKNANMKVDYKWVASALLFREQYRNCRLSLMKNGSWNQRDFLPWYKKIRPEGLVCFHPYFFTLLTDPASVKCASLDWKKENPFPGIDQKPAMVAAAAIDLITGQIYRNETGLPATARVVMVASSWRDTADQEYA